MFLCSVLQKKGKRKGLGGLSPEKKKLLKVNFAFEFPEDLTNWNDPFRTKHFCCFLIYGCHAYGCLLYYELNYFDTLIIIDWIFPWMHVNSLKALITLLHESFIDLCLHVIKFNWYVPCNLHEKYSDIRIKLVLTQHYGSSNVFCNWEWMQQNRYLHENKVSLNVKL